MSQSKLPIGIRSNNPGNIRVNPANKWKGRREHYVESGRFEEFETPVDGIRALAVLLTTYYDRHGLKTIRQIVSRWAPEAGIDPRTGKAYAQNTSDYVDQVATNSCTASISEYSCFLPDAPIDLHKHADMRMLVDGIIRHENGKGPLSTGNTWYSEEVMDTALARAGLPKPAAKVAAVPATKETVGATVTAGIGVAEIAAQAPGVMAALRDNEDHFTSGSWVRIGFGVALIVLAGLIAWGQIKRNRQGVIQ